MIDIIIPIYNASSTLSKTLESISNQKINVKYNVYLIDDCSNDNYDEIINKFNNLNIIYHRLDKNVGAGLARQKGIEISKSKFIVFLDSDDLFYDNNSLNKLYTNIIDNYDYVIGYTYDEAREMFLLNEGDLHGKIYRRKFINDNDIRFNNTRYHEDNFFNNLFLACSPRIKKIEDNIYYYVKNANSLTGDKTKEFERLEILLSNMHEYLEECRKRSCDRFKALYLIAIKIKYFNRIWNSFSDNQKDTFKYWLKKYDLDLEKYIGNTNFEEVLSDIILNSDL